MGNEKFFEEVVDGKELSEWHRIAVSEKTTEAQLLKVAEKCVGVNCFFRINERKKEAIDIALAISKNPNCTDKVLKTLAASKFPEVWRLIARSEKAKEGALTEVAKRCATIKYYYKEFDNRLFAIGLANILYENSNSNQNVMKEILNSRFPEVVAIGLKWIKYNA